MWEEQCSGPNILLKFERSFIQTSESTDLSPSLQEFQIISNNPLVGENVLGCEYIENWNSYYCENSKLGLLEVINKNKRIRTVHHYIYIDQKMDLKIF